MSEKIADRYELILLDVNGTFMFGQDRFGPDENFAEAYRHLGGHRLPDNQVNAAIRGCIDYMKARYVDPAFHTRFPPLTEGIANATADWGIDRAERKLLEETFASHELGHIPTDFADALHRLAARRRMGVISDIWAKKQAWLDSFAAAGIAELFEVMVFSSDTTHVKPSSYLFQQALSACGVAAADAVYAGDNLTRDVGGAAGVGMDSVWISDGNNPPADDRHRPTYVIEGLVELPDS